MPKFVFYGEFLEGQLQGLVQVAMSPLSLHSLQSYP